MSAALIDSAPATRRCARPCASEAGSTLVEVLIATVLMAGGVLAMSQLFLVSTAANYSARTDTFATVLAEQKLEQLRSLTWGFDLQGLPVSDFATDTSVRPEAQDGGTGLQPSPPGALQENTPGYVDHVDARGEIVGNSATPPNGSLYTRRWSIEPLPTNPNNTLILQVVVTPHVVSGNGQAGPAGNAPRLNGDARMTTVKTRKAQ